MAVLSGKDLSTTVRSACDGARRRLWIASPYIGGWQSVRSVLGREWWDKANIDVRLLTDEETSPNGDTLWRMEQKGHIHHLRGLHAKIYVFDDRVLLTSANLTGAAFSQRYETGVLLSATVAKSAIELYEHWWTSLSTPFNSDRLSELRRIRRKDAGEDAGGPLPILNMLPEDTGDFGGHKLFEDYPRFLDLYRALAEEYRSIQRIWPTIPVNFEFDGFLDYLFRHHPELPSKPYVNEKLPPRQTSRVARREELKVLAEAFREWANDRGENGLWRNEYSALVSSRLSLKRIDRIRKKDGILEVASRLQCLHDPRIRNRFLDNNSTPAIRKAWRNLLHGSNPLPDRMGECAYHLFGFKRSSVQELLGFFDPEKYPLRNTTVNADLRFFGFDVSAH